MQKVISFVVKIIKSIESFTFAIVRRTFPFYATNSEGGHVFLEEAFDVFIERGAGAHRTAPYSKSVLLVTLWKNFLSIWGSVFFWTLASVVERLVGMPFGLILPICVVIYFLYQELYVDAELGRKHWQSTLVDTILWTIPSLWFIITLIF